MKRVPFPELARMRMILAWVFVASLFCFTAGSCIVKADSSVSPSIYEFEEKNHYNITGLDAVAHASAVGKLTISNASAIQTDGFPTYDIKGDKSTITYSFAKDRIRTGVDGWVIVEDKSKEVNSEKLDQNIMNGAIVVQTSVDGNKWTTDKAMTDVFAGDDKGLVIFEPNEVQMSNGCYLRILVVYKEQSKVKDGKFLHFFDKPECLFFM